MRISNKARFISLVLSFLLILSILCSSVSVFAIPGSLIGPKLSSRSESWKSSTSEKGWVGNWGIRFKLVKVESATGDLGYFTVTSDNKISFKSNIINQETNKDEWEYFTPFNKTRLYSAYMDGEEFCLTMYGNDCPQYDSFCNILGLNDLKDLSALDSALQNYDKIGTDDDDLAKFFTKSDVSAGDYYYIVIELMYAMFNPDVPITGENNEIANNRFIWTTYQDYVYRNGTKDVLSCGTTIRAASDAEFKNINNYVNQGSRAPFDLKWADDNYIGTGYAIYGDIGLSKGNGGKNAAINIAVEYQGKVNTSIKSKYAVAASIIRQEDDTYTYWTDGNFEETSDLSTLFGTSKNNVVTDDPYTIVYENYYKVQLSNNKTADEIFSTIISNVKNVKLNWGSTAVTAGSKHLGVSIKPTSISYNDNNYKSATPVINSIKTALGMSVITGLSNTNYKSLSILKAMEDNINNALDITDDAAVNDSDGTLTVKSGKDFGVAVEFLVKGTSVTSKKITVNVSAGGTATAQETWNDTYSSAGNTICEISDGVVCYLAVPYSKADNSAVCSALSGKTFSSATAVLNTAKNVFSSDDIQLGVVGSSTTIGLGCIESSVEGYAIYEIIVEEPDTVGSITLPSYMLNIYYKNIIQTSSSNAGHTIKYTLNNKRKTIVTTAYTGSTTCGRNSSHVLSPTTAPSSSDDKYSYVLKYTDVSSGTTEINYDNSLISRYFVKMPSGVWDKADRAVLTASTTLDTKDISRASLVVDYGFNLVRAAVGDNRAISGISYASYSAIGDSENVLRYNNYFGVVPQTIKSASSKRNSLATVGDTITDTITINAVYNITNGLGYKVTSNTHSHTATGHYEKGGVTVAAGTTGATWVSDNNAVSIKYYTFDQSVATNAFLKNVSVVNQINYSFTSTVYKYETATLATGKNNTLSSGSTAAISVASNKASSGVVTSTNGYRFANVQTNNLTINFYPEVLMAYKISGTNYTTAAYTKAYTMGEIKRTADSSSLYLFKINGSGNNAVTGTTYSDAALGGTSSKGNNKVTIPAGTDVYVAANPSGITIDLYAYALDSIDKTTDSTFKTSASTTRNYISVVKSDADISALWGNATSNKDTIKNNFATWANTILDVANFSADFELSVNGSSKSENFSAVIGSIKRNNTISEDGVYQLQVANGVLLVNQDYTNMINQIATDYSCTEAEAKQLFEASGIYTSILNAIESSNSSFNTSGTANPSSDTLGSSDGADWTNDLGGNGNWYDEKVNTFVVRRFTNTGNQLQDITASDKIDYGLAPSGSSSNKQNATTATSSATWKLNIFFNQDKESVVNTNLIGSGSYYIPGQTGVTTTNATDTYTMLMSSVPVVDADFNISASSTSSFGY